MGTKSRVRSSVYTGIAVLALALGAASVGRADVTTERPGSILILPKVAFQAGGVRDTVIQISNTSNTTVHAKCYYINGAPLNPSLPPNPDSNPPLWTLVDFNIWLTRQQPTHWVAGRGRPVRPGDTLGTDGAGIDPGLIPPVVPGFTGELICIQVDDSGTPMAGNALKGEATLIGPGPDVSAYNAIAILGVDPDGSSTLALNGTDYQSCPAALVTNHIAEGTNDEVFGFPVSNRLTFIPCTHLIASGTPSKVAVSWESCDELEICLSGNPFVVDCYLDAVMSDAGVFGATAATAFGSPAFGPYKQTIFRPQPACSGGPNDGEPCNPAASICGSGACTAQPGLLGVIETTYTTGATTTRAANNLHGEGSLDSPGAVITVSGDDSD